MHYVSVILFKYIHRHKDSGKPHFNSSYNGGGRNLPLEKERKTLYVRAYDMAVSQGKGNCHQALWPELEPQDPFGEKRELTPRCPLAYM